MPHIIVEYTESLGSSEDIAKLAFALHENLAAQETINIHAIKTRALPVQYTVVGDGKEPDKMIHITLKLLPGRDDALKKTMAQGLFDTARKITHDDRISISVEVTELHEPSYTK
ncbi:MAG: 5-carboxymethyl-2-hydroxymuconate isomerase [Rhodospirillales bacterium]|mgnify:CR=1 FL=1|nr:5-carboxymethyl-2-hydroxymuconate isomerase [Alphaproteobacteria bacterium]MCB9982033.1 5-carboxymethyl-2-hydroxymuconate isomerase [Rhodospirillales bacterium]